MKTKILLITFLFQIFNHAYGDSDSSSQILNMERAKLHYSGIYRDLRTGIPLTNKSCLLDHDRRLLRSLLAIETTRFKDRISEHKKDKFILIHLITSLLYQATNEEKIISGTPILFDYQEKFITTPYYNYLISEAKKRKIEIYRGGPIDEYFEKNREKINSLSEKLRDDAKGNRFAQMAITQFMNRQNSVISDLCYKKIESLSVRSYPAYQLLAAEAVIAETSGPPLNLMTGGWHTFSEYYRKNGEKKTLEILGAIFESPPKKSREISSLPQN